MLILASTSLGASQIEVSSVRSKVSWRMRASTPSALAADFSSALRAGSRIERKTCRPR